jgi:hypothetical protein
MVASLRKIQCHGRVVKSNLNDSFFEETPVSWKDCKSNLNGGFFEENALA